ncbi:MAG: AraC family transcriptional regulator ligand-binding domain-containing protein [Pseudomonadota bacterium]
MAEHYFATGYVRLLYRFVRAEVNENMLFRGTGCTEADLMQAGFEMPFPAQMRLIENALDHAAPGLALRVGQQLQLAAHGALGTAMQSAADLQTALDTFAKYLPVRASFFAVSRVASDTAAMISIAIDGLPPALVPFFSESILFTLTHCLAYYTGRVDSVDLIQLGYPSPQYAADYAEVFEAHVVFDSRTTHINFDPQLLTLPSPEADTAIFEDCIRRCAILMEERQLSNVVQNVQNFLLDNPGKLWTVEEIAPLFAVSSRTLMRQLQDSGTTYQRLRDDVLQQQALIYLASMSVEAAALSLGFADTSSFRRTFKRWFGVPPSLFNTIEGP